MTAIPHDTRSWQDVMAEFRAGHDFYNKRTGELVVADADRGPFTLRGFMVSHVEPAEAARLYLEDPDGFTTVARAVWPDCLVPRGTWEAGRGYIGYVQDQDRPPLCERIAHDRDFVHGDAADMRILATRPGPPEGKAPQPTGPMAAPCPPPRSQGMGR